MSASVALRALIEQRFPGALPLARRAADSVATGIAALDGILPQGGFPRGRISTWLPEGGGMALLRSACAAAQARGERTGWIDGARTVGPAWRNGPILVRPRTRAHALRFTELILRSGGCALVVLTGVEPEATEMIRLSRAVHEGGGAFVALTTSTLTASLRLTSRFLPREHRYDPAPFGAPVAGTPVAGTPVAEPAAVREAALSIEARGSGWNARTTLRLPVIPYDLRLSLEPGLVDRRGASR